jgi:hypothetical protein
MLHYPIDPVYIIYTQRQLSHIRAAGDTGQRPVKVSLMKLHHMLRASLKTV